MYVYIHCKHDILSATLNLSCMFYEVSLHGDWTINIVIDANFGSENSACTTELLFGRMYKQLAYSGVAMWEL